MQVKMMMQATNLSKEELRTLIQAVREWELRNPRSEVVSVILDTRPQLSAAEVMEIFQGVYPAFEQVGAIEMKTRQLALGNRGIVIGGQVVGVLDEMTLSIAEASDELLNTLQEAETISLVKIRRG